MLPTLAARHEELEWIKGRLAVGGSAILLTGEAGVGKTRLTDEAVPEGRRLLRIAFPGARFAAPGMGLRRLLQLGGPKADALSQALADPGEPGSWKLASIYGAADELLRVRAPGVLVLDDLQWADDLTLGWLSQTADLLESSPISILMAARRADRFAPGVAAALAPLRRRHLLELLELGPLDPEGVREMASLNGFAPDEGFIRALHERTDGLPLAVEEMLRMLGTGQGLPSPNEEPLGELGVPPVLAMIVREQLHALGEGARRLLAAAALAPQPPSRRLVETVTGLSRDRFDEALEASLGSGLLVESGAGFTFRHDLQREALEQELPGADRRQIHEAIGRLLAADPDAEAGQVANQLIEAGETEAAVGWLERAAGEALETHDQGTALASLGAALDLRPNPEVTVRLVERATAAARNANRPDAGLRMVTTALRRIEAPALRGRLLVCRSRLALHAGDFAGRIEALRAARAVLGDAGDEARLAEVLGSLALPVDWLVSLSERIELGWEGLDLAGRTRDPMAIARCAGNLAASVLATGDRSAFELWRRAERAIDPRAGGVVADEYLRNVSNWALGAVSYGDSVEAGEATKLGIHAATEITRNPRREGSIRTVESLRLWKLGRWDAALVEARHGQVVPRPWEALTDAIRTVVAFERERRPNVAPLADAVASLLHHADIAWGATTQAMLMRIRSSRREPRPARGLAALIQPIVSTRIRVGWDDLLPAAALVDPGAYRTMLAMLGDLRPAGPRGEASALLAEGATDTGVDGEAMLMDAAAAFETMGEPYPAAQALEAATLRRTARGSPAGDVAARAAALYAELGANRSLASFLRRAPRARSLERFRREHATDALRPWGLTTREREVADLARLGYTAAGIADATGTSVRTVEKHIERVRAKLGARRKSDLVRILSDEMPPA